MPGSRGAPDLYAISPGGSEPRRLVRAVEAACAAGLRWVQLREKELPAAELLAVARDLVAVARRHEARLLVNDRADVAAAAGAHGVHLGEKGLPVSWVRRLFPDLLVGASAHDLDRAAQAEREGADFVLFGPVFPTPSKAPYGPEQGLEALGAVARRLAIPVVAVGGIGPAEVPSCLAAGARGVAAIRALLDTEQPAAAVRAFRAAARPGAAS